MKQKQQTLTAPARTFDHPVKPALARLTHKYFGLRNIPGAELDALGNAHNCQLSRYNGIVAISPILKATMETFYLEN